MNYDKGQASYESRLVGATTPEVQFDVKIVHDYVATMRAPDSERLLAARGFLQGDELTIAGALLFADHPQQWLPEAFVRVLRYRGVDRGTGSSQQLVVDERCDGSLPQSTAGGPADHRA